MEDKKEKKFQENKNIEAKTKQMRRFKMLSSTRLTSFRDKKTKFAPSV